MYAPTIRSRKLPNQNALSLNLSLKPYVISILDSWSCRGEDVYNFFILVDVRQLLPLLIACEGSDLFLLIVPFSFFMIFSRNIMIFFAIIAGYRFITTKPTTWTALIPRFWSIVLDSCSLFYLFPFIYHLSILKSCRDCWFISFKEGVMPLVLMLWFLSFFFVETQGQTLSNRMLVSIKYSFCSFQ